MLDIRFYRIYQLRQRLTGAKEMSTIGSWLSTERIPPRSRRRVPTSNTTSLADRIYHSAWQSLWHNQSRPRDRRGRPTGRQGNSATRWISSQERLIQWMHRQPRRAGRSVDYTYGGAVSIIKTGKSINRRDVLTLRPALFGASHGRRVGMAS